MHSIVWISFLLPNTIYATLLTPENMVTIKNPVISDKKIDLGYPEDALLDFPELAEKYGYTTETHTVKTEDGYILTMFRIPRPKNSTENTILGPPVLAMHGFVSDADLWLLQGPDTALGYQLADAGYDMWFANYRGTQYSRKHQTLNPDTDAVYWKFSYDQMAQYDLPAFIDYILDVRQSETLSYIGYSQGTAMFFAMGAYKPEYYEKVNLMTALAPIAWMEHAESLLLRAVTLLIPELDAGLGILGVQTLFANPSAVDQTLELICQLDATLCGDIVFLFVGDDHEQIPDSFIPVLYGHLPRAASKQNAIHLGQSFNSGKFQRYDAGLDNFKLYGQLTPPQYDPSLVTTPVALFIGKNDLLSSEKDVDTLSKYLPNIVDRYVIPREKWNHVDHLLASEACELVGKPILKLLEKYAS